MRPQVPRREDLYYFGLLWSLAHRRTIRAKRAEEAAGLRELQRRWAERAMLGLFRPGGTVLMPEE